MFEIKYDRNGIPVTSEPSREKQEVIQPQEPVLEAQPTASEPVSEPPVSSKETNLRIMRERAEKAEQERNAAMIRLKEIEEQRLAIAKNPEVEETLNPNDLVEWKHVDKKIKQLEGQLRDYQQKTTEVAAEAKLKALYPDFDKVVSADNIELLRDSYPELAATVNSTQDLYTKAVSAYTLIKKLGIVQEDAYQPDKARIQANAAKPKPLTSIAPQQGDTPLSHANAFANGELSKEMKAQFLKEMESARRSY